MFWRLAVIYCSLLLATLAAAGAATAARSGQFELDRLEEELLARARLVRDSLHGVQRSQLQMHADRLAGEPPNRMRITFLDAAGNPLAETDRDPDEMENHSRRPEILDAAVGPHGKDLRHSRSVKRELLYVALRADIQDSPVAFVRVALSPSGVRGFVRSLWKTVAIAAAVSLLLTLGVTVLVARRIARPIREVARAAQHIAAGSHGVKVYTASGGEPAWLVHSFNAMSERLAAEFTRLEQDHEKLRAILGGMVEGVIALDAEQRVLFANSRAAELLEFGPPHSSAESVGRKVWDVVRQRPLLDLVQRCLASGEPHKEELSLYGRASRSVMVHAVRLPGVPPRGAVLVIHDISELRRLERLRQEFVANVSHELKTPLTVIKANVETLLDEDIFTGSPMRGFLEQVAEQSERLHRLILDLLSLARIESGAETYTFQQVAAAELAENCLQRLKARAEGKNLTLEALPSPPDLQAWADEESVSEILDNLVDNAVKYTPAGGTIRVRWWSEDGWACVEVKDNGIGIPQQDLPRIFERFYRVDKARSRELGGTGLGLSIVKHLVQAMAGSIAATSEVGKGTSFVVRLPAQQSMG